MDTLITDYLKTVRDYAREDLMIALLEGELRKRKIRRARLWEAADKAKSAFESSLTDNERAVVLQSVLAGAQEVAEALTEEYKIKLRIGDCSWALETDEQPHLLFDDPHFNVPNVCVVLSGMKPIVVDVRLSVIKESKNIGDRVIVAAIHRYVDRLSLPGPADIARRRDLREKVTQHDGNKPPDPLTREQAQHRLKIIFDALTEGAKVRARKQAQAFNDVIMLLSLSNEKLSDTNFSKLAAILNKEDIKRIERLKLPTTLRSKLKNELATVFSDSEICDRILEFLRKGKLPRKRTGPAIRNAFFAFERKIDSASFRRYRSEELSQLRLQTGGLSAEAALSEKDIERIVKTQLNRILLHEGIGKLDTYVDVRSSTLVWKEMPFPDVPADQGTLLSIGFSDLAKNITT